MFYKKITTGSVLVALVSLFIQGTTAATTSLYIPGFDPQPIAASVIGVGSNGQTSWVISQGPLTDGADGGLPAPATLVEGPTFASVHVDANGLKLDIACGIDGTQAVCTEVGSISGVLSTAIETDTVVPFAVQVADTAAAVSTPSSGTVTSSASGSATPKPASTVISSSASSTATGTAHNSAQRPLVGGVLLGAIGLMGAIQCILG